jgi:predicted porin
MKKFKKIGFLSTITICSVVLLVAPVYAVSFKISGQINRAVEYVDNGVDSDWFFVDNDASSTRFRFVGSEEIGNGITAGIVWETEFESNTSRAIDIGQDPADGESAFKERILEAYFSGAWGKASIGQGDGAANGTTEVDLSGTALVTYSDVGTPAAGINFVDSTGAQVIKVGSVHANFDGLSRNDRLRYDSPKLGPVILSASATDGGAWELAARVTTELENIGKIAAAIGYVDSQDRFPTTQYDQIGASISWLHDTGVNLTLVYGVRDPDGGIEAENYYAKLGYKRGKHAVSVEWGQTDDLAAAGDEANSYGAGYVFNVYKGVELYAGYRLYELDRSSGPSLEDINILMLGTRVKFF